MCEMVEYAQHALQVGCRVGRDVADRQGGHGENHQHCCHSPQLLDAEASTSMRMMKGNDASWARCR